MLNEKKLNFERNMNKKSLLVLGVACMLLSSCVVSKKKFEIAEAGRLAALYSRDSLADLLGISRNDCALFSERLNALEADTTLLKNSIRNYQQLLASGQNENQKLNANLAQKISELQDREKTIAELQKMIDQQKKKVKDLLNSVKDALLGFSSDELTVREEDGKVYVFVGFNVYIKGSAKTRRHPKGTPIALVAMAREYGTSRGEAKRPFVRTAFKKNKITQIMQNVQKKYIPED